jgi:hypothetical protein
MRSLILKWDSPFLAWQFAGIFLGCGAPVLGQTNLALSSHWGALAYPEFQRGYQAGVTFLSFTEFDSDGKRFGVTTDGLTPDSIAAKPSPYPETVGFNFFSLAYSNHVNAEATELANMMYRYGLSLGLNSDVLTEHYQNEIIHRAYRDIKPVPRSGIHCDAADFGPHCLDYSVSGEILYRFTNLELQDRLRFSASHFFSGVGASLNSVAWEGYVQMGLAQFPTLINTDWFGIRAEGMARMGAILQNPLVERFGAPIFHKLESGYYLVQGGFETTLGEKVYPVVIGNNFTFHSGLFQDDRGQAIPELFWSLTLEIDRLYFETFNDMLGGTDYGPSFGVKFYWDFEGRSTFFKALERFIKGLNKS